MTTGLRDTARLRDTPEEQVGIAAGSVADMPEVDTAQAVDPAAGMFAGAQSDIAAAWSDTVGEELGIAEACPGTVAASHTVGAWPGDWGLLDHNTAVADLPEEDNSSHSGPAAEAPPSEGSPDNP